MGASRRGKSGVAANSDAKLGVGSREVRSPGQGTESVYLLLILKDEVHLLKN